MINKFSLVFIFVNKLSVSKIFNFLILKISYIISFLSQKIIKYGYPYSISIEPINSCNLSCLECPVNKNQKQKMIKKIDFYCFTNVVDNLKKYLMNVFLYFQGEPFLNDKIYEMIEYLEKRKIYTVISTNGHFLSVDNCKKIVNSSLDKIIISLDGANQEIYSLYRKGGDFEKVINGIQTLIETKKLLKKLKPFVELQFIVFSHNENQISRIKKIAKTLEVDNLKFKTAQINNLGKNFDLIPKNKKYSRYVFKNNHWVRKKKIKNRCWRLWNSCVINSNCDVLPCCFDKNSEFVFGNIKNLNILDILRNEHFKRFATNVFNDRHSIKMCQNCTE